MMIKAAAPIYNNNSFIGILYGGKLLNHDYKIVDKVKDIVYRGEVYKGVEIGTTTIFLDDVRISTNVKGKMVREQLEREVLRKYIIMFIKREKHG